MYYYLFSYGRYEGHTEYSLAHSVKYSDEEFSMMVDTACEEGAKRVMPEQIKHKKDRIKHLRKRLTIDKKNGHNKEWLDWNKTWLERERKETNLTIQDAVRGIIDVLVEKYGFEEIKHVAEQSFDEDFVIGKIPEVK